MPNGMYGGVRGRKTKVGRKLLLFSSYSIRKFEKLAQTVVNMAYTGFGIFFAFQKTAESVFCN